MPCYSADGTQTTAAATSVLHIAATATLPRRMFLYDIQLGSSSAAADASVELTINRITATGTSTAVVPQPLDTADVVAIGDAGENHTSEPTKTAAAILLHLSMHQRASPRWIARHDRAMIVTPKTDNNGVTLECISINTAFELDATFHFEE